MQGPLSSFGEAIGDAIDSVKAVTSNVADNVGREIAKNDILRKVGDGVADVAESIKEGAADLSERVGNEWEKATAKLDDRGRPVLSDPKSRDDEDTDFRVSRFRPRSSRSLFQLRTLCYLTCDKL